MVRSPPQTKVVPPPSSDMPVRGCLQRAWQNRNHDQWATNVVRYGYALPFNRQPLTSLTKTYPAYEPGSERDKEIQKMIDKEKVELVDLQESLFLGFYRCLFVVPKPGEGNWRPIIDLS